MREISELLAGVSAHLPRGRARCQAPSSQVLIQEGGPSGPSGSPLAVPLQSVKVTGRPASLSSRVHSEAGEPPLGPLPPPPRALTPALAPEARQGLRRESAKLSGDQTVAPWRPLVRLRPLGAARPSEDRAAPGARLRALGPLSIACGRSEGRKCSWGHVT